MFLVNLIISFVVVATLGGLYVVVKRYLEWYDDRFLDVKIGGWVSKQDNVVVQIIPPSNNERSMAEMENFFINLAAIYSKKSKKDQYTEGKWYEAFTFEVHSRGGQINFYGHFNRNHLPLFRGSLAAHYPTASVIESSDPFEGWPTEWKGQVGPYTDLWGTDINYGKDDDLHPLKSWTEFQRDDNTPITDPFSTLLTGLENIQPEDYIVLQFVLRPRSDSDVQKKWKKNSKTFVKNSKKMPTLILMKKAEYNYGLKTNKTFSILLKSK
ncbi:hypothetical protein HC864_02195 [Candidatus Gracilibacteria bacterium]|nr:hypothetical protein [Candidatus Gracilibacteria bacterium]